MSSLEGLRCLALEPITMCLVCGQSGDVTSEKLEGSEEQLDENGLCDYCRTTMSTEHALTLKIMCCAPPAFSKWRIGWISADTAAVDIPSQPGLILNSLSGQSRFGSLCIGDIEDVVWPTNHTVVNNMTHLYNCCPERMDPGRYDYAWKLFNKPIVHVQVSMDDSYDFHAVAYLKANKVAESLASQLCAGADVIVNCWAGCNRSACLCVYVLLLLGLQLKEAYFLVRQARGQVLTNKSFCVQLAQEAEILRTMARIHGQPSESKSEGQ